METKNIKKQFEEHIENLVDDGVLTNVLYPVTRAIKIKELRLVKSAKYTINNNNVLSDYVSTSITSITQGYMLDTLLGWFATGRVVVEQKTTRTVLFSGDLTNITRSNLYHMALSQAFYEIEFKVGGHSIVGQGAELSARTVVRELSDGNLSISKQDMKKLDILCERIESYINKCGIEVKDHINIECSIGGVTFIGEIDYMYANVVGDVKAYNKPTIPKTHLHQLLLYYIINSYNDNGTTDTIDTIEIFNPLYNSITTIKIKNITMTI